MSAGGPQLPAASEVDSALAAVFARPEFAERFLPGLFQRLAELYSALLNWFFELLFRLTELRFTRPLIYWLIIAWVALTAAAILVHLVHTALQLWRVRDRSAGPASETRSEMRPERRDPAWWEAEAARAAAAGRFRQAASALYQAVLLRLDERGILRFDRAKTPGEYRREAAAEPGTAETLIAFLRLLEPIAFGGRPTDGETYGRLRGLAAELGARD